MKYSFIIIQQKKKKVEIADPRIKEFDTHRKGEMSQVEELKNILFELR